MFLIIIAILQKRREEKSEKLGNLPKNHIVRTIVELEFVRVHTWHECWVLFQTIEIITSVTHVH